MGMVASCLTLAELRRFVHSSLSAPRAAMVLSALRNIEGRNEEGMRLAGAASGASCSACICFDLPATASTALARLMRQSLSSWMALDACVTASERSFSHASSVLLRGATTSLVMRSDRAMCISAVRCVCWAIPPHAAAARGASSSGALRVSWFLMFRKEAPPLGSLIFISPRACASWPSAIFLKKWIISLVDEKLFSSASES
mmetsp:Transcript_2317/g.5507  ORF Transcript_2317/g.5507 Transcript_2317/m.5507 type:complete len:202 (-) Transcript_2317:102-707(-)